MANPTQSISVVRFGPFELDLRSGELKRDGRHQRLQGQPAQLLVLLASRASELVTREELRTYLWPEDTFVDFDHGVNNAVNRIREVLSDPAASPRYIETVPRRGYRFIAEIEDLSPAPLVIGHTPAAADSSPRSISVESEMPSVSTGSKAPHSHFFSRLAWILTGIAAGLAASLWIYHVAIGKKAATLTTPIQSLAVLPLANLSGDPSQEYFADGMTELLTTDLGRIGGIRVISRTSVMRYKGTSKTILEIARELNVDAVIEGGVQRSGDRLRITAQLIQANNDRHLWSDTYEGAVREAFSLQDKVALDIAERVQAQFSGAERNKPTGATTIDPLAEEEYFRGRYDSNSWTAAKLESSIGHFEEAVQRDPRCAPAWAGLAGDYELMGVFGYLSRRTALQQSLTAAQRAVELNSSLADAHVFLASARWWTAWSPNGNGELARQAWSDAERELRFAIALNPNDAVAHQWLGYHLAAAGQFENAIVEMRRARELDPLSPNTQNSLGAAYYWAGRDDEASREILQVRDPDANSRRRHQRMARIYERKGMLERAAAELATAARLSGNTALASAVEREYRSSGYRGARKLYLRGDIIASQHPQRNNDVPVAALEIAADYALLGETAPSLLWLEQALQQDDPGIEYLKIDDRFESLRNNPRFQDLLTRLGLPQS